MSSTPGEQDTRPIPDDSHRDVLAELFPGAGRRDEVIRHWASGRHLFNQGPPKSLEEAVAERFPTPEALADYAPDMMVSVYGFRRSKSEGRAEAAPQELRTFQPRPISEALPLYHAGQTIICWRLLDHLPEALQRGGDILEAIGMPRHPMAARGLQQPWNSKRLFVVSLVYSGSEKSSGLGMHFDKFDSVVVHLRGQKRWRIGRNPDLIYPIYNEEDARRLDFPPSLPRLATRSDQVGELETIEMRRGSVLLLPRGTFHTTLADGEASLSLGYHFALPTWTDVVLGALERRLTQDPFMRGNPFDTFLPAGPSLEARDHMQQAAARATEALRDTTTLLEKDLLGNLASHHQAAYQLVAGAEHRILLGDPPVIVGFTEREVVLPVEAAALCDWLFRQSKTWFRVDDAAAAVSETMSPRAVWELLQECVEAGLLHRRWGRPKVSAAASDHADGDGVGPPA